MLLRLVIVAMTLLLLGAHVDSAVETVAEAEAASCVLDDDMAPYVVAVGQSRCPQPDAIHPRDELVPPSEELGRVFRPPRPSFV